MLLIKLNNQYYLLSNDELSVGDYVVTPQHELYGELGIEIIGDEYSRLVSKSTAKKIVASTEDIGNLPKLISLLMFITETNEFGVRNPDNVDVVLGQYPTAAEAFDVLIDFYEWSLPKPSTSWEVSVGTITKYIGGIDPISEKSPINITEHKTMAIIDNYVWITKFG